jgi:hypothetical protein
VCSSDLEYFIGSTNAVSATKIGGLSFGTTYGANLDQAAIHQETIAFTRYAHKKFAINTADRKLAATRTGVMSDSIFLIPEYKLNSVITLREVLRSDIMSERTTSELVLSVNPFGKKDTDRLRFEFAAGQTYDSHNEFVKSRLRFSTQLKL